MDTRSSFSLIVWAVFGVLTLLSFCSCIQKQYNAAEGQIVCYECYNIVKGVYQNHCPKNASVGQWAWKINCTGSCYTRTDDQNQNLIYRGCTDNQPFLPDPLPENGCYPYYLEVWCICSHSGCNGYAMGSAGKVELDAHLPPERDETSSDSSKPKVTCHGMYVSLCVVFFLSIRTLEY